MKPENGEKMKLYLVYFEAFHGEVTTIGIFSTREKAEQAKEQTTMDTVWVPKNLIEIEEYEIDKANTKF